MNEQFNNNEKESPIEAFKKKLYSKNERPSARINPTLDYDAPTDVPRDWDYENTSAEEIHMTRKKKSLLNKALYGSVIFVLIAILYAVISLGTGGGTISSKNIDISVSGPVSISAGDVLSLEVKVKNENDVALELTDLLVEYPEGTREVDNISTALKRYRESLGDIPAGKSGETLIGSVLFGQEGEKKTIVLGVEYRVSGSNAIFYTEREYEVEIVSSPITMSIQSPNSISSGQDIEFVIQVRSNSEETVEDVMLFAEYPFGFEFDDNNSTEPLYDEDVWEIGDLRSGAQRTIRIRGIVLGQDEEERTFRFIAGISDEFDEKKVGTPFLTHTRTVAIERPFLGLDLAINGRTSDDVVAKVGSSVRGDIGWINNLRSQVSNLEITLSFSGDILDRSTISSPDGFYRSGDNTLVWDQRSSASLSFLESGGRDQTSFSFRSLETSNLIGQSINPVVNIEARIRGTVQEEGVSEDIDTVVRRTVTLQTIADVSARAIHFSGPFINNGPMPPKADQETTYTITFSASNLLNDVIGAKVEAVLPAYVRYMDVVAPKNERITYNPVGGKLTWDIGDIRSGIGYEGPSKDVSFQIGLTPSTSQIGQIPPILTNIKLSGTDAVTDTKVEYDFGSINTRLSNDPQFIDDYSFVVQ